MSERWKHTPWIDRLTSKCDRDGSIRYSDWTQVLMNDTNTVCVRAEHCVSFRASDFRLKHCPWSASQTSSITQYTSSVWMLILAWYFQTAIIVETLKAFLFLQSGPSSSVHFSISFPLSLLHTGSRDFGDGFGVSLYSYTHTHTHSHTCTEVNFMIDFFPH